jgi:hypothetical protein
MLWLLRRVASLFARPRTFAVALLFLASSLLQAHVSMAASLSPGDILVADYYYENGLHSRILRVDPSGSVVTVLCKSEGTALFGPVGVYQETEQSLIVMDYLATVDLGAVFRLDLGSGALTLVASGPGVSGSRAVAFQPSGDFFLANYAAHVGSGQGAIYQVGKVGAPRVAVADNSKGAGFVWRIIPEPSGSFLFLDLNPAHNSTIHRYSPATGQGTMVSDDFLLTNGYDLARAPDGTIYVVTNTTVVRIAVDGTVSLVSSGGLINGGLSITVAQDGQILVGLSGGGILRIDPTTGAQSYFLAPGTTHDVFGLTTVSFPAVPTTPMSWGRIKEQYRH